MMQLLIKRTMRILLMTAASAAACGGHTSDPVSLKLAGSGTTQEWEDAVENAHKKYQAEHAKPNNRTNRLKTWYQLEVLKLKLEEARKPPRTDSERASLEVREKGLELLYFDYMWSFAVRGEISPSDFGYKSVEAIEKQWLDVGWEYDRMYQKYAQRFGWPTNVFIGEGSNGGGSDEDREYYDPANDLEP